MPTLTVLPRDSSLLHPGRPLNKPMCLLHVALYFSELNLLGANKAPASNKHSHSSYSLEDWKACQSFSVKGSLQQLFPESALCCCCLYSGISPQGSQPVHTGGKLSLATALAMASWASLSICQVTVRAAEVLIPPS